MSARGALVPAVSCFPSVQSPPLKRVLSEPHIVLVDSLSLSMVPPAPVFARVCWLAACDFCGQEVRGLQVRYRDGDYGPVVVWLHASGLVTCRREAQRVS